jgi:hypothetical protein
MSSKIEVSRELLERLDCGRNMKVALDSLNELRQILAAPVVERKPAAWSYKEYVWATGLGGSVWRDKLEREAPDADVADVKEVTPLYDAPPELAELQATIARLTVENERLQRSNDDLSASVKYWFNAKKQAHEQTGIECEETPYQPKGDWSFERLESGEIIIRNGKDWTVIKSGRGPAYEQFLYRFCEYQMKASPLALPDPHGKQSNLKDTQYAMGWNACLDKVKELNQ